jgi:hypothetical protein
MTSKNPVRSCEDVDESVLSYAEIKALAAGNPKIKEKMELDVQVAKLRVAKTGHQNSQYTLQDKLRKELPAAVSALENRLSKLKADVGLRDKNSGDKDEKADKEKFPPMTINGTAYDKRDEAGTALMALTNVYHDAEPIKIGKYRGFDMAIEFSPHLSVHNLSLKGNGEYRITMSDSPSGNITKINNVLNGFEEKIAKTEEELKDCANQERLARIELEKPFAQEGELAEKSARLTQLNLELNINNHNGGLDEEDDLTLSEDEEYDFRIELEDAGIDEAELFARPSHAADEPEEIIAAVGQELAKQGKYDALREEIENDALNGIEGKSTAEDYIDLSELEEVLDLHAVQIWDGTAIDPMEERKAIIAEARQKLATDGAMAVITDAMEGRAYSGEIVEIGSAYAVQKVDEGRGIIHNLHYLKDFTRVLNESNVPYLEITYDREMNGSVGVGEDACHGKTVAMGR